MPHFVSHPFNQWFFSISIDEKAIISRVFSHVLRWGLGQKFLVRQGPCVRLCLSFILKMVLLILVPSPKYYRRSYSLSGFPSCPLVRSRSSIPLTISVCSLRLERVFLWLWPKSVLSTTKNLIFRRDLLTSGPFLNRVPLNEKVMISRLFSHALRWWSRATLPLTTSGNRVTQTEGTWITILPRISSSLDRFWKDLSNRSEMPFHSQLSSQLTKYKYSM